MQADNTRLRYATRQISSLWEQAIEWQGGVHKLRTTNQVVAAQVRGNRQTRE